MCIDGVSYLLMQDENVGRLMSDPNMDLIHKQVVMTLYSLDAGGRLDELREILPLYLSLDWEECLKILDTIEAVGLLTRSGDRIALTHPIDGHAAQTSCGCHS